MATKYKAVAYNLSFARNYASLENDNGIRNT